MTSGVTPQIRGHVHAPGGRSKAEVSVMVTQAPAPAPDVAALTSPEGTFELETVGRGTYRVLVTDGHHRIEVPVEVEDEDVEVEVELPEDA